MNEFSNQTPGRGVRPHTRRMAHPHSRRRHRFGGCGSGVARDTLHRGRGERIHAVRDLHRALADVTRTGDERSRDEAARILAEATSRLNGLLAAGR